jgi:hypothetical protein
MSQSKQRNVWPLHKDNAFISTMARADNDEEVNDGSRRLHKDKDVHPSREISNKKKNVYVFAHLRLATTTTTTTSSKTNLGATQKMRHRR